MQQLPVNLHPEAGDAGNLQSLRNPRLGCRHLASQSRGDRDLNAQGRVPASSSGKLSPMPAQTSAKARLLCASRNAWISPASSASGSREGPAR